MVRRPRLQSVAGVAPTPQPLIMSIILSLIHKDLIVEYRSRQVFVTTLFFGLLVLVVGNFALANAGETTTYAPGVLWISFLFSGLLFLNHILQSEKEENTLSAILISPATPGHLFLGKMFSAAIFLIGLEVILLPVFYLLFNFTMNLNTLWLLLVIVLTAFGYCSLGVLFSTMSLGLKNREIILSVILFPILLPLLVIAVKSSIVLLNGLKLAQFFFWLKLLVSFNVIFVLMSYWGYFWIVEEV
jgi:heme exporter protein B